MGREGGGGGAARFACLFPRFRCGGRLAGDETGAELGLAPLLHALLGSCDERLQK